MSKKISLLITSSLLNIKKVKEAIESSYPDINLLCMDMDSDGITQLVDEKLIDFIFFDSSILLGLKEKRLDYFGQKCRSLWLFVSEEMGDGMIQDPEHPCHIPVHDTKQIESLSNIHFFKWIKNSFAKQSNLNSKEPDFDKINHHLSIKKMAVATMDGYLFVDTDTIIRCEAKGAYTTIYLSGGKKILSSRNIKEFDRFLQNHSFFRIHQTHLINLNKILRYQKGRGGTVIMEDGTCIEVASRRKNEFLELFESSV